MISSVSNVNQISVASYSTNISEKDKRSIIDKYGARERYDLHDDVIWKTLIYEQVIEKNLVVNNPRIRTDEEVNKAYGSFTNFYNKLKENYDKNPGLYSSGDQITCLIAKTKAVEKNFYSYTFDTFLIDNLRENPVKFNCVGHSLFYIALGQKMGWPIYNATRTEHSFIYYGDPYDERSHIYYDIPSVKDEWDKIWIDLNLDLMKLNNNNLLDIDCAKFEGFNFKVIDPKALNDKNFFYYYDHDSAVATRLFNYSMIYENEESKLELGREMYRLSPLHPLSVKLYTDSLITYLHEYKMAAEILKASIRKYPCANNYYNLSRAFKMQGDYVNAESYLDEAIRLDPSNEIFKNVKTELVNRNNALMFHELGWRKMGKKDYDGAIAAFSQLIEIDPDSIAAYNSRGLAKNSKGDYKGAIDDFNIMKKLDPNCAEAYYNCGNSKFKLMDYEGAITEYKEALRIKPDHISAKKNLKIVQEEYKKIKESQQQEH